MSRTIIESPQVKAARQFDLACQRRDLTSARRLAAKLHQQIRPGEPIDLARVRLVVRFYAAEIHGWDIP